MILFTILLVVLAIILVFSVVALILGGTSFIIVFGDAMICVGIIICLIKIIQKIRK